MSLAAAAALVVPATGAAAATVDRQPAPEAARTFAAGAPGWTTAVTRGGLVCLPPIICPAVDQGFHAAGGTGGAGDGFIRTRAAQLAAVAATATGIWRSPAFTPAGPVDRATLGLALRSDVDGLIAVLPDVDLRVVLVDVADPDRSVTVLRRPLRDTAGFRRLSATLPAGAVVPGRSYRLELRTRLAAVAAVPLAVTTDFDDVELQLIDAEAPSGLTATVPAGAPRVTGSVDPHGQATTVTVDYGPTDAYGDSAGPAVVDGDGPQPFTIPLADLIPGATYHYRVTAENLDGSIATTDATFVAPVPPPDAPPMVTGPLNSRSRDVTYDAGAGVTSAEIEIRGPGIATPIVVADVVPLGTVQIALPDADGTYQVRVVRHGAGTTTSADVPVVLDRTPPSVAGVGLQVTPAVSTDPERTVTFQPPADAVSAEAQVLDAAGDPVGDPVPLLGTGGSVQLGPADGTYRVEVTFADAAGNTASVRSGDLVLGSGGPGTGGPGTGGPGTPGTPGTPGAPGAPGTGTAGGGAPGSLSDPGGYAGVLGACYRSTIAITHVSTRGRRVTISGVSAFAPRTALTVRAVRGKRLGRTASRADGSFRATVRRPAGMRGKRARVRVVVGSARSNAAFIRPVNAVRGLRVAGRTVTVRGRVDVKRLGKSLRFTARGGRGAAACAKGGRRLKVRRVRIDRRTGAYSLRVRVPAGSGRVAIRTRAFGRYTAYSTFGIR